MTKYSDEHSDAAPSVNVSSTALKATHIGESAPVLATITKSLNIL
jgi:hypothetical protein